VSVDDLAIIEVFINRNIVDMDFTERQRMFAEEHDVLR
jgi:hypothetical protein